MARSGQIAMHPSRRTPYACCTSVRVYACICIYVRTAKTRMEPEELRLPHPTGGGGCDRPKA